MRKIEIANELLINTSKVYLKDLIENYILSIKELERGKCKDEELLRFHECINYIQKENFNIKGWALTQIPAFYSHCFWKRDTNENFDLAVWDPGEVISRYLDKNQNEQDAQKIQEAIDKFVIPDLT